MLNNEVPQFHKIEQNLIVNMNCSLYILNVLMNFTLFLNNREYQQQNIVKCLNIQYHSSYEIYLKHLPVSIVGVL